MRNKFDDLQEEELGARACEQRSLVFKFPKRVRRELLIDFFANPRIAGAGLFFSNKAFFKELRLWHKFFALIYFFVLLPYSVLVFSFWFLVLLFCLHYFFLPFPVLVACVRATLWGKKFVILVDSGQPTTEVNAALAHEFFHLSLKVPGEIFESDAPGAFPFLDWNYEEGDLNGT